MKPRSSTAIEILLDCSTEIAGSTALQVLSDNAADMVWDPEVSEALFLRCGECLPSLCDGYGKEFWVWRSCLIYCRLKRRWARVNMLESNDLKWRLKALDKKLQKHSGCCMSRPMVLEWFVPSIAQLLSDMVGKTDRSLKTTKSTIVGCSQSSASLPPPSPSPSPPHHTSSMWPQLPLSLPQSARFCWRVPWRFCNKEGCGLQAEHQ